MMRHADSEEAVIGARVRDHDRRITAQGRDAAVQVWGPAKPYSFGLSCSTPGFLACNPGCRPYTGGRQAGGAGLGARHHYVQQRDAHAADAGGDAGGRARVSEGGRPLPWQPLHRGRARWPDTVASAGEVPQMRAPLRASRGLWGLFGCYWRPRGPGRGSRCCQDVSWLPCQCWMLFRCSRTSSRTRRVTTRGV